MIFLAWTIVALIALWALVEGLGLVADRKEQRAYRAHERLSDLGKGKEWK